MTNVLDVKDFTVRYGKNTIVDNVSFSLKGGTINLLLGANGVGKSSIIKALVQDKDFKGKCQYSSIQYNGKEVNDFTWFRRNIVYITQNYNAFDFICDNPYKELMYAAKISGQFENAEEASQYIDSLLSEFRGDEVYQSLSDHHSSVSTISGGAQGLLNILCGLVKKDAKLMILDEPINNLDGNHAVRVSDYLTKYVKNHLDVAILIITHCRMFPHVDRAFTVLNKKLVETKYSYQTCFGQANTDGLYL